MRSPLALGRCWQCAVTEQLLSTVSAATQSEGIFQDRVKRLETTLVDVTCEQDFRRKSRVRTKERVVMRAGE